VNPSPIFSPVSPTLNPPKAIGETGTPASFDKGRYLASKEGSGGGGRGGIDIRALLRDNCER